LSSHFSADWLSSFEAAGGGDLSEAKRVNRIAATFYWMVMFVIRVKEAKMRIKKILWPTDFSKNAEVALPYLMSLYQLYDAEIHVLFVIEDLAHHESWYGELNESHVRNLIQWEEKAAKERLDQICVQYLQGCQRFIKHLAIGDPAREILKVIGDEGMDMVVMASKGQKGHFLIGSVAEKVIKHTTVPVVTIPIPAS
jgi:nucleotide-binding universal stress UspA family protein